MKIAVAGTGYVGMSLAVLLSERNMVTAVDVVAAGALVDVETALAQALYIII